MPTTSRRQTLLVQLLLLTIAGCSAHHAETADMMSSTGVTPPAEPRAATDHPSAWHVVERGGSVQASPRVYTVIWPGSEQIGQKVEPFVSWLVSSDYFTSALAEYGVGAGQSMGLIVMPTAAPATLADAELQAFVKQLVAAGEVDPRDDDNTQIAFIIPTTTTVIDLDGEATCDQILGYHSSPSSSLPIIAYDVIADCDPSATELDGLTKILSHEIAEAATDPYPRTGFSDDSPAEQEVSDLCNDSENLPIAAASAPSGRYWVQRQYSNAAAVAGDREPCLPLPWTRPYWGAALYPRAQSTARSTSPQVVYAWMEPFAYGDVGPITWQIYPDDGVVAEPQAGASQAGDTIPIRLTIANPAQPKLYTAIVESQSATAGASTWFSYVSVVQ
jgi:hypothetical protein